MYSEITRLLEYWKLAIAMFRNLQDSKLHIPFLQHHSCGYDISCTATQKNIRPHQQFSAQKRERAVQQTAEHLQLATLRIGSAIPCKVMKVASVLLVSSLTVSTSFILAPPGRIGSSFCRVAAEQEQGDVLLYSDNGVPDFDAMMDDEFDDDDDDEFDEEEEDDEGDSDEIRKPHARWSSLKQNKVTDVRKTKKERVVDPRFESKQDKKRREFEM